MAQHTEAPWLDEMVSLVGLREEKGAKHNPKIVEFAKVCGHNDVDDDETPWCAFSIGACLKKTGRPIPPVAVNGLARSYIKYGTKLDGPKPGAIAIWPRGKSVTQGHVNIVEKLLPDGKVECVGGNQSDVSKKSGGMVSRSVYDPSKALAFVWPPEPKTVVGVVKTATQSRRFMSSVTAFVTLVGGAIFDGLSSLAHGVSAVIDSLPGMTTEAQQFMGSSEQVMGWLGIPWGKVSLGIAAAAIMYFGARHIKEKVKIQWAD